MRGIRPRRLLLAIAAALLITAPAFPQASTASVSGAVRDQSGAVIPNAPVVLTKTDTNVASRTTSSESGVYIFSGVVPGPYKLEVSSPGMQNYEVTMTVQVGQSIVLDPVLQTGRTTTSIEVQDVTPMVTTDSPTLGTVLEHARIESLPINGRDFTALMSTVPGMEGLRAYGERLGSAAVSLDGASLDDRYRGGTEIRPPGLDTIQEFRVETNSSSAKYSRPSTVLVTTKSGTNDVHGTLFETNRNNAIGKARRREDTYSKAPYLNRNEYGGTFGGPVYIPKVYNGKNRTFFFFSYEGRKQLSPSTAGYNVPTEQMRNGDFSQLVLTNGQAYTLYDPWSTNSKTYQRQPFAYNGKLNAIDPSRMSPTFKYLMSITPLPNVDVNPLWDVNYWGTVKNRVDEYTTTFRIDHRFSDRDAFYARYNQGMSTNYVDQYSVPLLTPAANNITTTAPNRTLAMSWVRSVNATLNNELLLAVSREYDQQNAAAPADYAGMMGLPNPFGAQVFPVINAPGLGNLKYQPVNPNAAAMTYYTVDDNVVKTKGKHQFEFGVHARLDYLNTMGDQASTAGQFIPASNYTAQWDPNGSLSSPRAVPYTGYTFASAYLGLGSYMVRLNHGTFYGRAKEYAAYFQDKYRVTPKLTLFLGLRWEAWPAYHEKHYNMSSFDIQNHAIVLSQPASDYYKIGSLFPAVMSGFQNVGVTFEQYNQAGMNRDLGVSNWHDWAPRGGFAYQVTDGQHPLVLRGGVGLTYYPIPLRPWTEYARSTAPFTAYLYYNPDDSTLSPDGYSAWSLRNVPQVVAGVNSRTVIDPNTSANGMTRGTTANFFDPNLPDTRQTGWNMTMEKEFLAGMVAKASYFGHHTDYLELFYDWNRAPSTYTWYATTGVAVPSGANALGNRPYDTNAYAAVQEYSKHGWANSNGMQLEVSRPYKNGYSFQAFYVLTNAFKAGGDGYNIFDYPSSAFLPGWAYADEHQRNQEWNYWRDDAIPQHRLNGNFLVDLPVGKGKLLGRDMGGALNKVLGGWQVAGMGSVRTNRFWLPTSIWPTGTPVEIYGEKYPIQDCRSGKCIPGYLWWNGYINPNQINSYDANGKPNGVMGVPADYKPAAAPLNPWPVNPNKSDPMYKYYGTNTVFMNLKNGQSVTPTFDPGLHNWGTLNMPAPRSWGLDASLFKTIQIKERVVLRINADFFNVLNHPNDPTGASSEGLIMTRSSANAARMTQLSMRLTW